MSDHQHDLKPHKVLLNTHLCFKCGGGLIAHEVEILNQFYAGACCDNPHCERYLLLVSNVAHVVFGDAGKPLSSGEAQRPHHPNRKEGREQSPDFRASMRGGPSSRGFNLGLRGTFLL
jgi:hypothetical protein